MRRISKLCRRGFHYDCAFTGCQFEDCGEHLQQRLWNRLEQVGSCLLWTDTLYPNSAGQMRIDGENVPVHCKVYELSHGRIPDGYDVGHTCHAETCHGFCIHMKCIEQAHLVALPHMPSGGGFLNSQKTACPLGHPYDDSNTYRKTDDARMCRECHRLRLAIWNKKQWAREKAARQAAQYALLQAEAAT